MKTLIIFTQAVDVEVERADAMRTYECPQLLFPPRNTRGYTTCVMAGVDEESRRQYTGGEDETVVAWHKDAGGEEGSIAVCELPSYTLGGLTWVSNKFDQCRLCAWGERGLTL